MSSSVELTVTVSSRVSGHPQKLEQVNSFEDLKVRGSDKLNIGVAMIWKMTIETEDLDPNTCLQRIQSSPGKEVVFWTTLDKIMESLKAELTGSLRDNDEALCIYNFFEMQLLGNVSNERQRDEDWFEGLPNCATKSAYMKCKASSRIYNYYREIKKVLDCIKGESEKDRVLDEFRTRLLKNRWHNTRFLVESKDAYRKCDREGKFRCQGVYDLDDCPFHHIIYPYRTRHGRLQFQLWEFDHCIEKSFVIEKLKDAIIGNNQRRQINTDYFYELFFTKNLKLVFGACHDKQCRDNFNREKFEGNKVYKA